MDLNNLPEGSNDKAKLNNFIGGLSSLHSYKSQAGGNIYVGLATTKTATVAINIEASKTLVKANGKQADALALLVRLVAVGDDPAVFNAFGCRYEEFPLLNKNDTPVRGIRLAKHVLPIVQLPAELASLRTYVDEEVMPKMYQWLSAQTATAEGALLLTWTDFQDLFHSAVPMPDMGPLKTLFYVPGAPAPYNPAIKVGKFSSYMDGQPAPGETAGLAPKNKKPKADKPKVDEAAPSNPFGDAVPDDDTPDYKVIGYIEPEDYENDDGNEEDSLGSKHAAIDSANHLFHSGEYFAVTVLLGDEIVLTLKD
jgi:hypothetical protein